MTSMGCPGALRLTCKGFAREWVPQSTTGASAKPNEASGSEMTVPRAAIPLLLGTVLVLAGLVVWRLVGAVWVPNEARDIAVSVGESSIVDIVPPTSQTSSNPRELAAVERPWKELPAKAVINSPNCILIAGTGGASGVAVVLAGPGRDAAWFAVVDEDGVLFGAHLDFGADGFPLFDLGRRPDGSVLMGFRTVDLSTQIFQDGQPIYEAEGVRNFDIASDGSSFLAIEPLAGGASRLVIRNFALGLELHHDLGDLPIKAPIPLLYSADGTEAIIRTGTTQRFYPVDGGEPREIRVPDRGPDTYTIPQSHEVGFRVQEVKDEFAKIARLEYRFGDNGREPATVEAWSRTFAHAEFGEPTESPFVSKDGAWVVLGFDRRGMVIDALTGETAVSVPFDEDARRARGNPTGVHFQDGRFFLYRQRVIQDASRRFAQRFVEVFDPHIVNLQGEPVVRVPVDTVPQQRYGGFFGSDTPEGSLGFSLFPHGGTPERPCARPVLSDGRMLVADGDRLTYQVPPEPD